MSLRKCKFLGFMIVVLSTLSVHAEEWKVHESHMAAFQLKINTFEKQIHELSEQAKSLGDSANSTQLNEEIAKTYADLKKVSEEYRVEKLHIRFKHPEKGDIAERKYPRYKLQSLEDLENDVSLDGQLDRLKEKLKVVYQIEDAPKKPSILAEGRSATSRKPASTDEERIILSK